MKRSLTAAVTIVFLILVAITAATLIVSAKDERPVPMTIIKQTYSRPQPVPAEYLTPVPFSQVPYWSEHQEWLKQQQ
jgi:hypothetical protein